MFVLHHIHLFEIGHPDFKLIGVYSTRELAQEAAERLVLQPGFCEAPDGFQISVYPVDQDTHGWVQGRFER